MIRVGAGAGADGEGAAGALTLTLALTPPRDGGETQAWRERFQLHGDYDVVMWANLTLPTVSARLQLPDDVRNVSSFQLPPERGRFARDFHRLLASDYASRLKVRIGRSGLGWGQG